MREEIVCQGIEFNQQQYDINGSVITTWEAGEGPLVLLIHGFPDTPHTFEYQYPELIAQGYRVVAPFLPGYFPSRARLEVGNYHPLRLGEDMRDLIEALGCSQALVIGHDWGAIAANMLVSIAPEKVEKLIVAAVPHWNALTAKKLDFKQMLRSRYALFFQLGRITHFVMQRNNLSGINYLWNYWSPSWDYSEEQIQQVKNCLNSSDSLWNAMGYYRAICQQSFGSRLHEVMSQSIETPTRYFAGINDGCIGVEVFERPHIGYLNGELIKVPAAGHFMHRENPEFFNHAMLAFLAE